MRRAFVLFDAQAVRVTSQRGRPRNRPVAEPAAVEIAQSVAPLVVTVSEPKRKFVVPKAVRASPTAMPETVEGHQLIVIETPSQAIAITPKLEGGQFAWSIRTSKGPWLAGKILCAAATSKGPTDPIYFFDCSSDPEVIQSLKQYFESSDCCKCTHSYAHDVHALENHGITLRGVSADTRLWSRMDNTALGSWEGAVSNAKTAALNGKGYDLYAVASNMKITLESPLCRKELLLLDRVAKKFSAEDFSAVRAIFARASAEAALLTSKLAMHLSSKVEESVNPSEVLQSGETTQKLFDSYYRQLLDVLVDMERVGFCVDKKRLCKTVDEAKISYAKHVRKFREIAKAMIDPTSDPSSPSPLNPEADDINPGSSSQIRQLLYGYPSDNEDDLIHNVLMMQKSNVKDKEKTAAIVIPRSEEFKISKDKTIRISGIGLRPILSESKELRLADFSSGKPLGSSKLINEYSGKDPLNGKYGDAFVQLKEKFGETYAKQACEMLHHLSQSKKAAYVMQCFGKKFTDRIVDIDEQYGRIHPTISLDTSTGRLVCRDPNFHSFPNTNDFLGIRKCFCAAPGKSLVVADYSQLELRIMAHATGCKSMIDTFAAGGDYHSWTAAEMFPEVKAAVEEKRCVVVDESKSGLPTVKQMFGAMRNKAKAVNFSIAYGKSARSLAEDLKILPAEAEKLLERWYETKPEVKKWKTETIRKTASSKNAISIIGKSRDIPHIGLRGYIKKSERAAVNYRIQGSAADIAVFAMKQLHDSEEVKQLGFKLIMQIHDEFVLEGPTENAEEALRITKSIMERPFRDVNPDFQFRVDLVVDAGIGPNWASAKP